MKKYRVVVTDDRFGSYRQENEVLQAIDTRVEVHNLTSGSEAIAALADADGVLVNLHPLPAEVIRKMKKCQVISRYGVGYDNVDVKAATEQGIWVARVPDYSLEDVSDQALALLLGAIRKISYKDRRIREGGWNLKDDQPCYRIKGKVLGLIGFGAIARTLRRKVSGLGLAKVLVYDPYVKAEQIREQGGTPENLETLLRESDYISIHAPLTEETKGMIGKKEISLVKPNLILINTSRGPLLQENAVAAALAEGRIGYAGLDVFESEPLLRESPLRKLDNVILSDHSGWYSEESLVELKTKAARNVLEVLQGGKPAYPVNNV